MSDIDLTSLELDGPLVGGRYRLGRLIGRGGQGSTHVARDEEAERVVAVKVFDLRAAGGWKDLELFQRECEALRQLDHPGIPDYHDELESEDGTRAYLVMEYIEGVSLREGMRRSGSLEESDLWQILRQGLTILAYLHQRQPPILHRDIKPSNLVVRPSGDLVLVDFGGVRLRRKPGGGSTVVGTLGYMAPEQLYGEASAATDIYALGATLVALASGSEPEDLPRNGLRIDVARAITVSAQLQEILHRMTAPDPADRPQSAAGLLGEIDRHSRASPSPVPQAPPPRPAPGPIVRRPRRRTPMQRFSSLPLPAKVILGVVALTWLTPFSFPLIMFAAFALFILVASRVAGTSRSFRRALRQLVDPDRRRAGHPPQPRPWDRGRRRWDARPRRDDRAHRSDKGNRYAVRRHL